MDGTESTIPRRQRRKPEPDRKPRRWAIRLSLLLVTIALGCFAPRIIARTPLCNWAIKQATGNLSANVTVEHVTLGWLSPIVLRSISATDESGAELASIDQVRVDGPLWRIVMDQSQLGIIEIQQPRLRIQLRSDGSNLEDALRPLLNSTEPSGQRPNLAIRIIDGQVDLTDGSTGHAWRINRCEGQVDLPADETAALSANLTGFAGTLQSSSDVNAGAFAVDVNWPLGQDGFAQDQPNARLAVNCDGFPSEMLAPLAVRWFGDVYFDGSLSADFELALQSEKKHLDIRRCEWREARLHAPEWLGTDQPRFANLSATGRLSQDSAGLHADQFNMQFDAATCRVNGVLRMPLAGAGNSPSTAAMLNSSEFEATGEIDLAKLAALMPHTLRIRDGMRITSGKLVAALTSKRDGDSQKIEGSVATSDLAAMYEGQNLVWRQPLQIEFSARETAAGPVMERLVGTADFLRLEGQGTLESGSLIAEANLDRLATELNRFVDLGEVRLAGVLGLSLEWRRANDSDLNLSGAALVERFVVSAPNMRPWQEQRLDIKLDGRGSLGKNTVTRIDTAKLAVQSGEDQLDVELTKPVTKFSADSAWPLKIRLVGELERWTARLQPFVSLNGWDAVGWIEADGVASLSSQAFVVESSKVAVEDFGLTGAGLFVREPMVKGEFVGAWNSATSRFESNAAVFQTSALSVRASNIELQFAGERPSYQGSASFQGDLQRIGNWWNDPNKPTPQQFRGLAVGTVQLTYSDGATQAHWQTDVKDFAWLQLPSRPQSLGIVVAPVSTASNWETLWAEPQMSLRGDARWNHAQDFVDAQSLELAASAVKLRATGKIQRPSAEARVNLTGEIDYDLPKLVERFRGYLGPDVQLTGGGTRAFRLEGPLFADQTTSADPAVASASVAPRITLVSRELTGNGSIGWDAGQAFGLQVGPGELNARIADAAVQVEPIDLAVSEGRLKLAPRIELMSPSPLLTLPQGPIVESARLSPELCSTWFKYIAPLLADATAAEGRVSVSVDGVQVPLAEPVTGSARGIVHVHSAKIGPGPLSRELLSTAQQIRALLDRRASGQGTLGGDTWVTLPEQDVGFDWQQQRVHHHGLTMLVRDIVIRTQGDVGFDQSLALTAEFPIRDEWIANQPLLASMRGQSLQVPVRGSVTAPRADPRVLEQFGKQLARDVTTKALEGEIQKGIQKIFGPRP